MRLLALILTMLVAPSPGAASDTVRAILGEWHVDSMAAVEERLYAPIKLRFTANANRTGGRVSGLGGCNVVGRGFEIKNGALTLRGPLRATRRYCGGLPRDIQSVAGRILGHETGWTLESGQLVLSDASGVEVARFGRRIPSLSGPKGNGFSLTKPSR